MVAQHILPKFGWPLFAPSASASRPIPLSLFCYPAESGKKSLNLIAVPIAAACKAALGVHGNSCAVQGCSVLLCASLAAPHSDSSSTKLCAVSAKKWKEVRAQRQGQHGSLYELLVCRTATAFDMMGFLSHFSFFVFMFDILWLLDFSFSLPLSVSSPLFSTVLICTFTTFYLLLLTLFPLSFYLC